jgi:formate hydrogenlyase subunit 6/NADH:ubiquinone oxidoreductase subunit I
MKQYLVNVWTGVVTVLIGMKVTFKHLFVPAVTIQYPDVRPELPERERNRLYVNMDDCIGCDQCARACPVDCIQIETVKSLPTEDLGKTSNGKKKALWVTKFDIDIAKCCYCQLCVFPCPTECIYMTDVYEFSEYDRNKLVYDFVTLTQQEIEEKKDNFAKMEAEKAAQKAAAAAEKAAAAAKAAAEKAAAPKADPKPEPKSENKSENNPPENTGSAN